MFNGEKKVLYYADALTEIAFVIPSLTENSGQDFLRHLRRRKTLRVSENGSEEFCCCFLQRSRPRTVTRLQRPTPAQT